MAAQHEHFCLSLCLHRQRHVNRHLVAIEIGVERLTNERWNSDRLAFHQNRQERLDSQSVQRRRTVEQDRMIRNHFLYDIPHWRIRVNVFSDMLRTFNRLCVAVGLQSLNDKRLEQFDRHPFRDTTLV